MPDSLRVPPAHDIPMVVGVDLTDTVRRYRSWLLRGAGPFGYAPARHAAPLAIGHAMPLHMLETECRRTRPPSGHDPNLQIIRTLWTMGDEKQWKVFDAPKWRLPFRAGLSTPILADRLIVEDGRAFLFWMQMRTGVYAPTQRQLALLGRFFLTEATRQGEEDIGLLVADMRYLDGAGARALDLKTLDDLHPVSEDEAESKLQMFADAYDVLMNEKFDPSRIKKDRKAERDKRKGTDPGPDLFR